jgi:hypothetical protein
MLEKCRKNGFSVDEADALLVPVRAACAESLPAEAVFTKIEEGLAKKVSPNQVVVAAELRLDCLRRASRLVAALPGGGGSPSGHGHGDGWPGRGGSRRGVPRHGGSRHGEGRPGHGQGETHGGDRRLVARTAMALESGLPEEVLQEVFGRHGGWRYGRMIHVMEAGETLQLAGLDPQDTKRIMMDCIDRDLNRMEIQRAVGCIVGEYRNGRDFESIYAGLWVSSGGCP